MGGTMTRRLSKTGAPLNALGPRLRELRLDKSITQAELARRLQRAEWDCDPVVLNKIESQRRTLTDFELLMLVENIGVKLGEVCGG